MENVIEGLLDAPKGEGVKSMSSRQLTVDLASDDFHNHISYRPHQAGLQPGKGEQMSHRACQ